MILFSFSSRSVQSTTQYDEHLSAEVKLLGEFQPDFSMCNCDQGVDSLGNSLLCLGDPWEPFGQ